MRKMFPRRKAFIESIVEDMVQNPGKYAKRFEEAILGRIETERSAFVEGVTQDVTQGEFATRRTTAWVLFKGEAESERPLYRQIFFLTLLVQLAIAVGEHKYAESKLNEIQGNPEDKSDKGLGIIPGGRLEKWFNKQRETIKARQLTRVGS
ncbi:MAG: hypothetical protein HY377_02110 [Candidatus Blackburnbacteria bacterium]|nr:hypothetical protein [Candidatus Blackburnbacteria bacterium]